MKRLSVLFPLASAIAFGQVHNQPEVHVQVGGMSISTSANPVVGAPYSATVTNETVQVLADGNRIVQNSTGTIARDSQGRTRQDTALPRIGNMDAVNAPHLVFLQDPVAQTAYTLNLTAKTAEKMPTPPPLPANAAAGAAIKSAVALGADAGMAGQVAVPAGGALGPSPVFVQKFATNADAAQVKTEDLGSQAMEGVTAQGVRTTRTIAAGEIGNDKPIDIVTEVWTSPELKTVVYSKRSDPRLGEQTFKLTNITRGEPDPSLFTIPSDFKITSGPDTKDVFFYRPN